MSLVFSLMLVVNLVLVSLSLRGKKVATKAQRKLLSTQGDQRLTYFANPY